MCIRTLIKIENYSIIPIIPVIVLFILIIIKKVIGKMKDEAAGVPIMWA